MKNLKVALVLLFIAGIGFKNCTGLADNEAVNSEVAVQEVEIAIEEAPAEVVDKAAEEIVTTTQEEVSADEVAPVDEIPEEVAIITIDQEPVQEAEVAVSVEEAREAQAVMPKEAPPMPQMMVPTGFAPSIEKVTLTKDVVKKFEEVSQSDAAKAAGLQLVESMKTFAKIMLKLLEKELNPSQKEYIGSLLILAKQAVKFMQDNIQILDNVHQADEPTKKQMMNLYMQAMMAMVPFVELSKEKRNERMLEKSNPGAISEREVFLRKRLKDLMQVIESGLNMYQPEAAASKVMEDKAEEEPAPQETVEVIIEEEQEPQVEDTEEASQVEPEGEAEEVEEVAEIEPVEDAVQEVNEVAETETAIPAVPAPPQQIEVEVAAPVDAEAEPVEEAAAEAGAEVAEATE